MAPSPEAFAAFWALGSSLASNPSQRPCQSFAAFWGLALTPSWRLRRRLLRHSGRFPRALFFCLQKATLGTSLASNASQRPCQRLVRHSGGSSLALTASWRLRRLLLHSGGSSLASTASWRLRRRLLRHSGRFPRAFLVPSESNVRH